MRQGIGVKWGLITNGKSYKLFTKNDDNSESKFLEFDLKDLEDNPRLHKQ